MKSTAGKIWSGMFLCHEDILFNTQDWGIELKRLVDIHQDIGLQDAGAVYKSAFPNPWISVPYHYYRTNTMRRKRMDLFSQTKHWRRRHSRVAVLDVVFIAGKRSTFEQFHGMRICCRVSFVRHGYIVRVGRKHTIAVKHHIGVTHRSMGELDGTC